MFPFETTFLDTHESGGIDISPALTRLFLFKSSLCNTGIGRNRHSPALTKYLLFKVLSERHTGWAALTWVRTFETQESGDTHIVWPLPNTIPFKVISWRYTNWNALTWTRCWQDFPFQHKLLRKVRPCTARTNLEFKVPILSSNGFVLHPTDWGRYPQNISFFEATSLIKGGEVT